MKKLPSEVGQMTLREAAAIHRQIEIEKALELDTKIKIAGDKKGFKDLKKILNKDKVQEVQDH